MVALPVHISHCGKLFQGHFKCQDFVMQTSLTQEIKPTLAGGMAHRPRHLERICHQPLPSPHSRRQAALGLSPLVYQHTPWQGRSLEE